MADPDTLHAPGASLAEQVLSIRSDFPALRTDVHGRQVAYFDNAATSQKPQAVIDRLERYYRRENANVHRGVHTMSQRATDAYESARDRIASFINAGSRSEVVLTSGTTESVNLVASCWGGENLGPGDEILVTGMEHHSNIVPWQLAAGRTGADLKVVPVTERGELDWSEFERLLAGGNVRILAVVHTSNSLGTVNPVRRMISDAHSLGVPVLLDGAQALPHGPVDVQDLDCDFLAFSSHKMFGPTGVGVLYGKEDLLDRMPPWQGGGDMIEEVSFEGTTFNELPYKFEAGTPNIADTIGLGAAIDYLESVGYDFIRRQEADLLDYATSRLTEIEGLRIIGTATEKASVVSFLLGDSHPYDVGAILDRFGIAVRTGHHCTQPLMQ
ncbi:MAG: cysteine desulfurase, partial [Rhodothermales bacterium]|nr:cysteine desulfurase [Rhodothermales bacterium]